LKYGHHRLLLYTYAIFPDKRLIFISQKVMLFPPKPGNDQEKQLLKIMDRNNTISHFILSICILVTSGCTKQLYQHALSNAAHPSPARICQCLTVIKKENLDLLWTRFEDHDGMNTDFVLMASWKKASDTVYFHNDVSSTQNQLKYYATKSRPIFVTAFSDLQKWYSGDGNKKHIDKRLTQLLGLPPDTAKRVFILFWVRPQDLIRPCVDPEITDNTCEYKININTADRTDCDNLTWLTQFTRDAYSDSEVYKQFPFTQLGYTYDWSKKNKQHIGVSEFVIGKDKFVRVAGIFSTENFLNQNQADLKTNININE
jgi:hypothetical protein